MVAYTNIKMVDIQDFNDLVVSTYGIPYDYQQQDGCKGRGIVEFSVPIAGPYDYENHTVPEEVNGDEMGVSFKAWLSRDPNQKLNKLRPDWDNGKSSLNLWYLRNFYPSFEMVIQDLYEKGLIEAGDYTLNIDW